MFKPYKPIKSTKYYVYNMYKSIIRYNISDPLSKFQFISFRPLFSVLGTHFQLFGDHTALVMECHLCHVEDSLNKIYIYVLPIGRVTSTMLHQMGLPHVNVYINVYSVRMRTHWKFHNKKYYATLL